MFCLHILTTFRNVGSFYIKNSKNRNSKKFTSCFLDTDIIKRYDNTNDMNDMNDMNIAFYKNENVNANAMKNKYIITKPQFSKVSSKLIKGFEYKLLFNGCVQNTQSYAGASAIILKNNDALFLDRRYVGKNCTNQYAQYKGLILGLTNAIELNIKTLLVKSDSEIINQLNNNYLCDFTNTLELYKEAKQLEKKFDEIKYITIPNELNRQAFMLANLAIEENEPEIFNL